MNYEVDYNYKIEEFGTFVTQADTADEAEQNTLQYVRETHADNLGIEIEAVREVQKAA